MKENNESQKALLRLIVIWSQFLFLFALGGISSTEPCCFFHRLVRGQLTGAILIFFFFSKGKTLPGLAFPAFCEADLNSGLQILAEGGGRGFQPFKLLLARCWPCLWLDRAVWTLIAAVTQPEPHSSALLRVSDCAYNHSEKVVLMKIKNS